MATDVLGNAPEFCRWLFEFTAKCLNAHWGRWEDLWASEQPSIVRLADEQAQLAKAVYTLTNPVAAGLVTEHHHWPGVISLLARMARPRVYKRPVGFFRENGPLPRHATLTIAPLPALAHASQDEYLATLRTAVVARETELARERQRAGRSVLGRRQVLRQSAVIVHGGMSHPPAPARARSCRGPTPNVGAQQVARRASASSRSRAVLTASFELLPLQGRERSQSAFSSPGSSEPRRHRSPRVAGGNKWARIEALARLRSFLAGYREAWLQWRAGARGVVFPFGTYGLRVYAGVCCAQAP
ncbi:MAG: hypothetical protein IPG96_00185 [Proteobacteria bacterium]|nr:hypothetical protein [Pseudomonadota bacterium]